MSDAVDISSLSARKSLRSLFERTAIIQQAFYDRNTKIRALSRAFAINFKYNTFPLLVG